MKLDTRTIIGIILILLGILFFAEQIFEINISIFEFITRWWPLLFVYWGAYELKNRTRAYITPIFAIIFGLALIGRNIDILPFGIWETLFPVALILIGIHYIFGPNNPKCNIGYNKKKFNRPPTNSTNSFDESQEQPDNQRVGNNSHHFHNSQEYTSQFISNNVFFSGSTSQITSQNFKGGEINVIFGGTEIDLRPADLDDDFKVLELNAIFGGIEIFIPYNWRVEVRGTPLFGGIADKTRFDSSFSRNNSFKSKTLRINCTVIFGGIEIKN